MSGIYDVDSVPPHECKDYDIEELPISAESALTAEEKWDIIFHLSRDEKVKYEHYIHQLVTCKGERKILKRLAKNPTFTQSRNQFIYDNLDGTPDRFIKGIINKYYEVLQRCEGLTYTDLIQESWIALIRIAKQYIQNERLPDKMNTAKFSTVAYSRVEGHLKHIFRDEIKQSKAESEYDQKSFENSIDDKALAVHKMEQLSEQEQRILELYAEGYSTREIADEMEDEISHMTVSRRLNKIGFVTKRP